MMQKKAKAKAKSNSNKGWANTKDPKVHPRSQGAEL